MTNREYELLEYIRSRNRIPWFKVLNAFGPESQGRNNDAVLKKFLSEGLIEPVWPGEKPPRCVIRLTNKGILALLEAEEQMQLEASLRAQRIRKEQTQQEKELQKAVREQADAQANRAAEHRFQIRLTIWNTVLSAALGAFLSNLDRLIPLIIRAIQWFTSFR